MLLGRSSAAHPAGRLELPGWGTECRGLCCVSQQFLSRTVSNDAMSPPAVSVNGNSHGARRAIGAYRIVGEKGSGRFGSVYLGEHSGTGRPVAIRILPRGVTDLPGVAATLRRRARSVVEASQTHPALVGVLEYGVTEDGQIFAVMERAEGHRLSDVLADRPGLDVTAALRLAIELGGPLETLHNQGFVHAAVRPENFVIGADGGVKLLDVELVALRDIPVVQPHLVEVAPPAYLTPEQIEGNPASEKSDVYAFGVLLYRMLSGALPFEGRTRDELFAKHLRETPGLLNRRGRVVPVAVEAVLVEALDKVPERRPFMQRVLNQLAANRSVRTSRWKRIAAPAAGLVAAAVLGVPLTWTLLGSRPVARASAPKASVRTTPAVQPAPVEAATPSMATTPSPAPVLAIELPERPAEISPTVRPARVVLTAPSLPTVPRPQPVPAQAAQAGPSITPWRPVPTPPMVHVPAPAEPRVEREISRAVVPASTQSAPAQATPVLAAPAREGREGEDSDSRAVIDWLLNQRVGEQ
jgi:eukaryotic-like serine/threonine-protein kinase